MHQSYEDLLKEFQDKYNQFRRSDRGPIPITVVLLRLRLITEELGELAAATLADDRLEIADAMGDLGYVIMGTLIAYGMNRGTANVFEMFPAGHLIHILSAQLGTLSCVVHEAIMSTNPEDPESLDRVEICLRTMFNALVTGAIAWSIPFDAVFREIHRSNMTKAVPTISNVPGMKYGQKVGVGGKGPNYQPPRLAEILGESL